MEPINDNLTFKEEILELKDIQEFGHNNISDHENLEESIESCILDLIDLLYESDEEREFVVSDGNEDMTFTASSHSDADDIAIEWIQNGFDSTNKTYFVHGTISGIDDEYLEDICVEIEPNEPLCVRESLNDFDNPYYPTISELWSGIICPTENYCHPICEIENIEDHGNDDKIYDLILNRLDKRQDINHKNEIMSLINLAREAYDDIQSIQGYLALAIQAHKLNDFEACKDALEEAIKIETQYEMKKYFSLEMRSNLIIENKNRDHDWVHVEDREENSQCFICSYCKCQQIINYRDIDSKTNLINETIEYLNKDGGDEYEY